MKVTPILFSSAMIRALLNGRKTQTRRIIKTLPNNRVEIKIDGKWRQIHVTDLPEFLPYSCRYGGPGDLLYVRETWASPESNTSKPGRVAYDADGRCGMVTDEREFWPHGRILQASGYEQCFPKTGSQTYGLKLYGEKWRPSIHLPRWASRITLELTDVRVEQLQDITTGDAWAEGCPNSDVGAIRDWFKPLWDSLNASRGFGWNNNPWVWALTFKVHNQNVDKFIKQQAAA